MTDAEDNGGQLHTLALLEQLHAKSGDLWGRSSELYFHVDALLRQLSNPNLHDIQNMSFRVEWIGMPNISDGRSQPPARSFLRTLPSMRRSRNGRTSALP